MENILTQRNFEIDDMFRFEYINEAQLSPDGKRVIYTLMRTDEANDKEIQNLWLLNLEDGTLFQLTYGDWIDQTPVWTSDGLSIIFLSDRTGTSQIYQLDMSGGEAHQIGTLDQGCNGPLYLSPDGKKLIFHARSAKPNDMQKPYRIARQVYRLDGAGYTDTLLSQVFLLNLENRTIKQLTNSPTKYSAVSWSADSQNVLVLSCLAPDSKNTNSSIQAVDLDANLRTILVSEWGLIENACWLGDGRVAFIGKPTGSLPGAKNNLWVMSADGSGLDCRTSSLVNAMDCGFHYDVPVLWGLYAAPILPAQDGTEIVTCLQDGGELHVIKISTLGEEKIENIAAGQRYCFPLSRVGNKLIFGGMTIFDPSQLFAVDLSTKKEVQLTTANAELLAQIKMPEARNIHFPSSDGTMVEGWVLVPEGKPPFPTILHIHGGPHSAYGHVFSYDFLTLAGAGYAVIFINHRGSTGYGDAFASATKGDWGNLDYQDLMAAVDHVIELGITDPDRLGCCGVSGGGNLTCWLVGHTDRFKAAVPENALTNFHSLFGTSDIGATFAVREMGGKPHELPEVYTRCSPITYAHLGKTPTLLVVGENDFRCPPEQSEQFYTTLKENGCVAEMLRFPGGSHDSATIGTFAVRRAHNEALLEWMDRYVKPMNG